MQKETEKNQIQEKRLLEQIARTLVEEHLIDKEEQIRFLKLMEES
jgi:hypothetical protein